MITLDRQQVSFILTQNCGWLMQSLFLPTGRPKNVKEQDVYICDYRLDKSAHLFYKIHRNRYPVCTKLYAFNHFPKRLTPKRDFSVRVMGVLTGWGCCRTGIYYWFISTERYFKRGANITAQGTFCVSGVETACGRITGEGAAEGEEKQMRETAPAKTTSSEVNHIRICDL